MTSKIHYTPEAEQQLTDLDGWITENASADTAARFVRAILDHGQNGSVRLESDGTSPACSDGRDLTPRQNLALTVAIPARGQHRPVRAQPDRV